MKDCSIFSFNMSLKHLILLLLIRGFCEGEIIRKCFTLNNITTNQGLTYVSWNTRLNLVEVDAHCPNGLIHFGQMAYSIPIYKNDFCMSENCSYVNGRRYTSCDCCKRPGYRTECHWYSPVDADCGTSQECKLSIEMVDLSEHCANQTDYPCDQGYCQSRWVEVRYECIQGMDKKVVV